MPRRTTLAALPMPSLLRSLALLLLSGLAWWSTLRAATPLPVVSPAEAGFSPAKLEALHDRLGGEIKAGRYSGYIALLARDGRIVDWRAHGWQDIAAQTPLQRDSIVRIYSMSKIVTSVAILTLLEDGKLKLDDLAEKFLPALKNRMVFKGGTADAPQLETARRPFTVRDLLTHTAGYYYDAPWSADAVPGELMRRENLWAAANLDDFVARVAKVPLHEQPGTRYRYGINTDLLGAIVEKASGRRLDDYLQERLFGPLGMTDTGFWVPAEKRRRLATIYHRDGAGKLVPDETMNASFVGPDGGVMSGGGGLYSTAADYLRFAQMLLNGGELDGVRILSRKTVELMTQNHLAHLADPHPFGARAQGFGLGVRVMTNLGESHVAGSVGSFGWDGAATTLVHIDPRERTVALLLFQHVPFNQDDIFAYFLNGFYASFAD
jgi:CubicO group peptidase (beta-lactamase class C family)